MAISDLPHLNAALNAVSTVLLITGWILIKRRRIQQHRAVMIAAVVTSALFLTSYVLAHNVAVWQTWGSGSDQAPWVYGFYAGFFTWLGFILPILLNSVAFERKSWTAFGIQLGYQFISLQIMGMILSYWR